MDLHDQDRVRAADKVLRGAQLESSERAKTWSKGFGYASSSSGWLEDMTPEEMLISHECSSVQLFAELAQLRALRAHILP